MLATINHIVEGTSRVISQYRDKTQFLLRLACYLDMVQRFEDELPKVSAAFDPATATGFRLDWLGLRVGQPRRGVSDDTYRPWILARIAANRSLGKIADIRKIAALLLPAWRTWQEPLAIYVDASADGTTDVAQEVQALLQRAAPAGVPIILEHGLEDPQFTFAVVGDTTTDGCWDTEAGVSNAGYLSKGIGP